MGKADVFVCDMNSPGERVLACLEAAVEMELLNQGAYVVITLKGFDGTRFEDAAKNGEDAPKRVARRSAIDVQLDRLRKSCPDACAVYLLANTKHETTLFGRLVRAEA